MDEIPETRDSLLIRVADARDQAAWEQFARIYWPVVYNVARMRGLQDADTPEWLERVIQRLLAKSLDDRIQTAEHIANLLQRCLAHLQQPMNVELPEEFRMQKNLRGFMSVSKKITRTVAAIALSTLLIAVVYFLTRLQPSLTAESKSTQSGEISFSEGAARDETSLPESEAEKAIARMVLVFSQDQARRAVHRRGCGGFVCCSGQSPLRSAEAGEDGVGLPKAGVSNVVPFCRKGISPQGELVRCWLSILGRFRCASCTQVAASRESPARQA